MSTNMSGRIRASVQVSRPATEMRGRPITGTPIDRAPDLIPGQQTVGQPGATGGPPHVSPNVAAEFGKLTPSLAAGIRRAASTK